MDVPHQYDREANFAALQRSVLRERVRHFCDAEANDSQATINVLARRLAAYHKKHPRKVVRCWAPLLPKKDYDHLIQILDSMSWRRYNVKKKKYIKGMSRTADRAVASGSQNFVMGATLGPLGSKGFAKRGPDGNGKNTQIVKLKQKEDGNRCWELWRTMRRLVKVIDPSFTFTSMQVNRNFVGKPHRDKKDRSYQYALSLGEFSGGALVAETDDPEQLVELETKGRLTKCDGRRAHWVSPYTGTRYSLIMYRCLGKQTPVLSNKGEDTNAL
eukprot:TRINITY_DN19955_c0_g1_i1.p1 TRINITY_DN19955_c0_g1~~TRINITY_DN19955_c0_g1_i1.p1  ORF type:complete len:272 (-),score=40.90 TRINITY_DN19955_c0_g1_i1:57-872(-)